MFHQTTVGKPKRCLNRNCRHPFVKESHLGWLVKSEIHVYAIMKCLKCKTVRPVIQLMSMAHEYKEALPKNHEDSATGPISKNEIINMRKKLDTKDSLKSLMEGLKPNGSILPEDDSEKK